MNLAIIPARQGSKGVPGKNVKKLGGVPLMLWTLDAAFLAGKAKSIIKDNGEDDDDNYTFEPLFDIIVLTSDSDEYLELARKFVEARHPKMVDNFIAYERPSKLGVDNVQTDEVCLDVLRSIEEIIGTNEIDSICLLQPTSPFRTYQHINESHEVWTDPNNLDAKCLISGTVDKDISDGYRWYNWGNDYVKPIGHSPEFRLGRQWEEEFAKTMFKENGAIYWFDADSFSLSRFYRKAPFIFYEMSEEDSVDIDTPEDWDMAEKIVSENWKR